MNGNEKVMVPLMVNNRMDAAQRARIFDWLHRAGADMVFLASDNRGMSGEEKSQNEIACFRENIPAFEAAGFEVGIWTNTLGHGGPLAGTANRDVAAKETLWVGFDGNFCEGNYCPLSDTFADHYLRWIGELAQTGVRTILLDDDYRMSLRGSAPGCLCDRHLKRYCEMVGETLSREQVRDKAFCGKAGRHRAAWLQLQGDTLRNFAARIRAAVDAVDPTIRIGMCCDPANFDAEGTDPIELSRIFAGSTRPLLRLTGAPYWARLDNAMMTYPIETDRLAQSFCDGTEIETFHELDTYPHSGFLNPVSFTELEDTVLIADGRSKGTLKYMARYHSHIDNDSAYLAANVRNRALYREVARHFDGKQAVGLNLFEVLHKFKDMEMPEPFCGIDDWFGGQLMPPISVKWMRELSLPLTYNDLSGASVVFSENAAYVTPEMLKKGMVLNLRAARILHDKGVDVGYTEATYIGAPAKEYYRDEDEWVAISDPESGQPREGIYALTHQPGVRVVTDFLVGDSTVPGVYEYENADGNRFVVLPFWEYNAADPKTSFSGYTKEGCFAERNDTLMRSYCRQRQMAKSVAFLNGRPLCATCPGHPYLYLLAKQNEISLTVGLWNFNMDAVETPQVTLGEPYTVVETLQCEATLSGTQLQLTTDIPPMSFAVVTVSR